MRLRRLAPLPAALLLAGLAAVPAVADTPATLYVSNLNQCSDSGPGTQAEPFCTIQAAVDVVQPGQTVMLGPSGSDNYSYHENVDITRSGTPTQPITFTTYAWVAANEQTTQTVGGTITLSGVHDVAIENLTVDNTTNWLTTPMVTVTNSTHVTITHLHVNGALAITGGNGVTATRNLTNGISVSAGATGSIVSDNVTDGGIAVAGATGTDVVNNTGYGIPGGAPAIAVTNASTDTSIENNWVESTPVSVGVSVAADSTAGSTVDYNDVVTTARTSPPLYSWAGTDYATATALQAATGQAAHDLNGSGDVSYTSPPPENSPVIDSADANAPGASAVDFAGNPRVDDPLVTNTGTGVGYYDRGAVEREDPVSAPVTPSSVKAPTGAALTFSVAPSSPWAAVTGYKYDFGDGTAAVQTTATSVQHAYSRADYYWVSVTVTDSLGNTATSGIDLNIVPPAPLVPNVQVTAHGAQGVYVNPQPTDSWPIAKTTCDYGDRSAPDSCGPHAYAAMGNYPITVTITDVAGNTVTWSTTFSTGSRFVAYGPVRVLDTRYGIGSATAKVPGGGTLRLKIGGNGGIPAGVTSVVLNLTVTDTSGPGFVSAYPDGVAQPASSTLNFVAGQTVPNATIVPVGSDGYVDLYTHGASADLIADATGYFVHDASTAGYDPTSPVRLMDTRGGGTLGPWGTRTLTVAGVGGVPASGVTGVALNVTVTGPASPAGYVTVYPDGRPRPNASNLNFVRGQTVPNMVIVPVGPDGKIDFYNGSGGNIDLVADLAGYFSATGGLGYVPVTPYRAFDTRTLWPPAEPRNTLQEGVDPPGSLTFSGSSTTMVLNTTVTDTLSAGFLTVYGWPSAQPATSNLNWTQGETVANMTIPSGSGEGIIQYYNGSNDRVDVIGDVLGYFSS